MCQDHPYYPGELPPEHFFVYFTMLAAMFASLAAVLWVVARAWRPLKTAAGLSFAMAAVFEIIGIPCLIPFAMRRTDEWPALRRAIQAKEAQLHRYQLAHPGWTKEQVVEGFLEEDPGPSGFEFSDPAVRPVWFKISDWRDDVPRVVVAYNECNNTLFDSDTMWVEVAD